MSQPSDSVWIRGSCSDCFSTPGLGSFFVSAHTTFPQRVFQLNKWTISRGRCWISGCGLRCGLPASQEIIKIITVACANSVQVLRHNTRWDRAPHASSQGPGSSRLPWEPLGSLFLVITPFAHSPFLICTMLFSDNPHPPWYIHTIHACTHSHIKKPWHTSRQARKYEYMRAHTHTCTNIRAYKRCHAIISVTEPVNPLSICPCLRRIWISGRNWIKTL